MSATISYSKAFRQVMSSPTSTMSNPTMMPVNSDVIKSLTEYLDSIHAGVYPVSAKVNLKDMTFTLMVKVIQVELYMPETSASSTNIRYTILVNGLCRASPAKLYKVLNENLNLIVQTWVENKIMNDPRFSSDPQARARAINLKKGKTIISCYGVSGAHRERKGSIRIAQGISNLY